MIILAILIIPITLIISILIDVFIVKEQESIKIAINKIKTNKKYLVHNIVLIIQQATILALLKPSNIFILYYFMMIIMYKITCIDIKTKVINSKLMGILLGVSIVSLVVDNGVTLIGSLLTGLALIICLVILSKVTGNNFGMGDAKIIAILGVIFGFSGIVGILIIASGLMCILSIGYLMKSFSNRNKHIPFTPFLEVGILVLFIMNNI